MASYPSKFSTHKKKGAIQMSPIMPSWESDAKGNEKCTKEGALLIEVAPIEGEDANGNMRYDWASRKIAFALGVPDIANIIERTGTEFKLIHKNEAKQSTKTMNFKPGDENSDKYAGTMMLSFYEQQGDIAKEAVTVPLSKGEWAVFVALLRWSLPFLLGWERP
jgi:hypothetical protein